MRNHKTGCGRCHRKVCCCSRQPITSTCICPPGPPGPPGSNGSAGPPGPPGPPGPSGPPAATVAANFYDSTVVQVANNANLPLSVSGPASPSITNIAGVITFALAGLYEIDLNVAVAQFTPPPEFNNVQAFLNGATPLPQANFSALLQANPAELANFGGSFLVQLGAGDTLEFRNLSGDPDPRTFRGNLVAVRLGDSA